MKRRSTNKLILKAETLSVLTGGVPQGGEEEGTGMGMHQTTDNSQPIWHCACANMPAPGLPRTPLK